MMVISNWFCLKINYFVYHGYANPRSEIAGAGNFMVPSQKPFRGTSLPAPRIYRECFPSPDARY